MSTETPETPSSSTPSADGGRCAKGAKGGRRGRRLFRLFLLLSAVGAGAFFLPRAFAGGGWGGERGCHQSAQSAQDLRERAEWGASWFYDEIDATDAQRAQLDAVLDEAAPVAFGFKQESKALKGQLADALSAPQVERAGTPIGANDLLLAAQALDRQYTFVTNNTREFRRVAGLRVEDWLMD